MSAILNLRSSFEFCLCGHGAKFRCDWIVTSDVVARCGKSICEKHALEVGLDKHLCPFHQQLYESWKRRNPGRVREIESGKQESLFA